MLPTINIRNPFADFPDKSKNPNIIWINFIFGGIGLDADFLADSFAFDCCIKPEHTQE